ncbi:MAG: hypothetical protein QXP53_00165 [Candidatus Pacearchaeota archaeon]
MGKEKYLKKIEELFEKSPVVSFLSIAKIVKDKRNSNKYPKQLVRNLILKGKIKKITKGYYTAHEDPSLAVFCFKPSYLGLQDALSFHDLWEQETIPVIITTKKVRQGIRRILGINVLIKRIDKKYFFGYNYYKQGNFYLPYSDIEKTFIDMIYFKEKLSEEALKNILEKINKKKLNSYLKIYPKRIKKIVLKIVNNKKI